MKSLLVSLVCLFSMKAMATPKAYVDIKDKFWNAEYKLMIDGKVIRPTLLGFPGMAEAMASNPVAQKYAEEYQHSVKWGYGWFWGGLAAAIAYGASESGEDGYEPGVTSGIFALGWIGSMVNLYIARRKFVLAMNHYNGVPTKSGVPFDESSPKPGEEEEASGEGNKEEPASSFFIFPSMNGLQLAYTF